MLLFYYFNFEGNYELIKESMSFVEEKCKLYQKPNRFENGKSHDRIYCIKRQKLRGLSLKKENLYPKKIFPINIHIILEN